MYKHVKKQQKLSLANKPLILSDEDSDSSASELELSNSDNSNSDSDSEGAGGIEVMGTGFEASEEEDSESEEEEIEIGLPEAGFPSCEEAIQEGGCIIELEVNPDLPEEEVALICVVCESKNLKLGKMLVVHLGSKDHVRRMKRFKNYVLSEEFPAEYNQFDAKSIAKLLDKQVNIRLTSQSQYGGSIPVPTTKSKSKKRSRAEEEDDSNSDEDGSEADSESEPELPEGTQSKRAAKKLERNLSTKTRKLAIKEKLSALKAGTSTTTTKPKTFKPKPSPEEIALRQAAKKAARALLLTQEPSSPSAPTPVKLNKKDTKKLERKIIGLASKTEKTKERVKMFDGSGIVLPTLPAKPMKKEYVRDSARSSRGSARGRAARGGGRGGGRGGAKKPKWAKNVSK